MSSSNDFSLSDVLEKLHDLEWHNPDYNLDEVPTIVAGYIDQKIRDANYWTAQLADILTQNFGLTLREAEEAMGGIVDHVTLSRLIADYPFEHRTLKEIEEGIEHG